MLALHSARLRSKNPLRQEKKIRAIALCHGQFRARGKSFRSTAIDEEAVRCEANCEAQNNRQAFARDNHAQFHRARRVV